MAHQHEGVNPLRPYYIPPSIGEPAEPPLPTPGPRAFTEANATGKYTSKARDIFSDIDYKNYIADPSPSAVQTVKEFLDELLWKYTSVLLAQPFEVAKTLMQVRVQDDLGGLEATAAAAAEAAKQRPESQMSSSYGGEVSNVWSETPDSGSEGEEESYFTSNHLPQTPTPSYPRSQRPRQPTPAQTPRPAVPKVVPAHQLYIRTPDSILEVIAQLWQKESAWGVWKGANATFFYSVLQSLLENFSRSLLSAVFNVPDLGVKNDMERLIDIASPYPWASLFVAAAASVTTGLILAPLDLIRTRFVITSTARGGRRTLSAIRNLPSYICHPLLFVPTILHSLVHPILTLSAPLVLRSQFHIDRETAPVTFSLAKICSSAVALFIKLPLETVLRRGQVAVLSTPEHLAALEPATPAAGKRLGGEQLETIVPVGGYSGVFSTMYNIVYEEGSHVVTPAASTAAAKRAAARRGKPATVSEAVYRRGQGLDGLWRGWKVSAWGLVGLWSTALLAGGGDGEF